MLKKFYLELDTGSSTVIIMKHTCPLEAYNLHFFVLHTPYQDGVSPLQSATQLELQWEVAEWLLSLGALNSEGINEQVGLSICMYMYEPVIVHVMHTVLHLIILLLRHVIF